MTDIEVRTECCTLTLDAVSGDLRQIAWHEPALELIREPRLGENFRVLLPLPGQESNYFCSQEQEASAIETDATGVTCTYERLRNGSGEQADVRVEYRIECRENGLEFSVSIDNKTDHPVAEVMFGILGGLHGIGRRAETRSVVPGGHVNLAPNLFHTFPAGEYGGGNLGIRHSACGFPYPGEDGMSMSWASFYNPRKNIGLYFGSHDIETRLTALYLELRPCTTSAVRGSNWPRPADLPGDEPTGLTAGWVNFPYVRRAGVRLGPVRLQVHRGDWRTGSEIYRNWFDTHFPVSEADWLRDEMAWQSTILRNPEDVTVHRFSDLPALAEDARKYDVTAFEILGWDVGGIDRGYPDYQPDPALGSRDDFRAALSSVRAAGVKPVVFANLQVADTASEAFQRQLRSFAIRGRWAEDLALLGWGEGTIGARMGLSRSTMAILSLSHPELRKLLVDQMIELVRDGAAALQLDKTVAVRYLDFNEASPVSPDRSAPEGLLMTLAEILQEGRRVDPEFALASETWWDRAFQYVNVLYSRMTDIDIADPTLIYTFPEVTSTIFAENPTDFNVMNNGMRYGMVWALAPRHYNDSLDERLTQPLARYVRELIRIRARHRDVLFHGRFQDTLGAQVSQRPDLRYSVFRTTRAAQPRQACVVVNYGDRSIDTSVTWGGANRAEICQPYQADRVATLPADIQVPPHSCAVVAEIPPQR